MGSSKHKRTHTLHHTCMLRNKQLKTLTAIKSDSGTTIIYLQCVYTQTDTHTRTRTHAHMHTCTQTDTKAHTPTHKSKHMHYFAAAASA